MGTLTTYRWIFDRPFLLKSFMNNSQRPNSATPRNNQPNSSFTAPNIVASRPRCPIAKRPRPTINISPRPLTTRPGIPSGTRSNLRIKRSSSLSLARARRLFFQRDARDTDEKGGKKNERTNKKRKTLGFSARGTFSLSLCVAQPLKTFRIKV